MRSSFFFGALAMVGACKDAQISLDDLDTEALRARCERSVRCGLFSDQDECEAFFRIQPDVDRQPAIDQGLVHYDGAAAKRCYDAVAGQTCDSSTKDGRDLPGDCNKIFTGTIGDGDTCESDAECASARCETTGAPGADMCSMGSCASSTKAELGDACAVTTDCVADSYCNTNFKCVALGQSGDTCFLDEHCDVGLLCGGTGFPKLCVTAPAEGEACPDLRCAQIGDICPAGTCVPGALVTMSCTTDADCSSAFFCDLGTHQCADLPGVGAPCSTRGCNPNSFCDMTEATPTCRDLKANLEPCDTAIECASFFCPEGSAFDACADQPVCI